MVFMGSITPFGLETSPNSVDVEKEEESSTSLKQAKQKAQRIGAGKIHQQDAKVNFTRGLDVPSRFSRTSTSRVSIEVQLQRWVNEVPLGENRLEVKARILSFFYDPLADSLDLSCLGMNRLPNDIFRHFTFLQRLKSLDLSCNHLEVVPDSIGKLKALQSLKLHQNLLKQLPDTLSGLESLVIFDASHNHLEALPASVGFLKKLLQLRLQNNRFLKVLPQEIEHLNRDAEIFLQDCGFSEDTITQMQQITSVEGYLGPKMHLSSRPLQSDSYDLEQILERQLRNLAL